MPSVSMILSSLGPFTSVATVQMYVFSRVGVLYLSHHTFKDMPAGVNNVVDWIKRVRHFS